MGMAKYSDEEIATFLELAQDVGIGRAIRVAVDDLKARSKAYHDWYETEEALLVAQTGMARVHEALMEQDLNADEQKKLAEAYQKYANTWLTLQGKANSISESRALDSNDVELLELINEQRARNAMIEQTN